MSPGGLQCSRHHRSHQLGVLVQGSIDPTQEIPYLVTDQASSALYRGRGFCAHSGSIAVCTHTDISQLDHHNVCVSHRVALR